MGKQIDKLANFIMQEIPNEPRYSESAVECAMRIMTEQRAEIAQLKTALTERDHRELMDRNT